MADGITEALISELGKIHSLRVISRTSVMQYKNKDKSLRDIARELDVDAVLESGMQRFGGRFRIDTRLRSASNEAQLWGTQFEREVGDIFRLQAELAQEVAQGIRAEMTSEEARLFTAAKKVNPSAEENYIAGRRALWRGNVKDRLESIKLFDEAVRLQPDYAAAYASRSLAWHLLRAQRAATPQEAYLPALNDAKKALELDPRNAEAYVTLAGVKSFEEWDWAEADRLYKKAQALNPGSMDLCFCYTFFLYNTGKFKEALVVAERGIRTDPLNATAHTMLGRALYAAREYERALPVLRRAIELNSNNLGARIALARSYLKLGRRDEALAAVDLPSQRPSAVLAYVFAAFQDRREEAVRTLAAVEAQPEPARSSLYDIAIAYFALNDVDAGLDRLAKAMERHDSGVAFARYDPALDPVRQNPRFKELVARLKLD
jgi:adenylate cyclase